MRGGAGGRVQMACRLIHTDRPETAARGCGGVAPTLIPADEAARRVLSNINVSRGHVSASSARRT